ncbi:MAG: hypothetical protein DMF61_04470 [Blastocatellia bacterium AA13]|nr:MAG: hypothetical protein DMF61_04470 [Blastocatellia bacterium AA13]
MSVAVFGTCIQDDSSGDLLYLNSGTGEYLFLQCSTKAVKLSGIGKINKTPCTTDFTDTRSDRKLTASINSCTKSATASIQITALGKTFVLTDRKTTDDACICP